MRPIIFSFHVLKIMRYARRVVDGCQAPTARNARAAMPRMAGENDGLRLSGAAAARVQRESAASVPPAGPPSRGRSGALHRSFSARMAARAQDKDPPLAQMGGGGYIVAAQRSQSEVMTHHAPPALGTDIETGGMCELSKFLFGKKHRELPSLSSCARDAHHPRSCSSVIGRSPRPEVNRVMRRGLRFRTRGSRGREGSARA